jgi:hypothetical protein
MLILTVNLTAHIMHVVGDLLLLYELMYEHEAY